jgi:hypothetical protein
MRTQLNLGKIGKLSLFILFISAFAACEKSVPGDDSLQPYNINVTLRPNTDKEKPGAGFGFIKFRQDPDTARIITLDTWVANLLPNHDYQLQRAVNPITDADCTSTMWLTLGEGLVPKAIHTDNKGNGQANLFRDITAIARGTEFRIHFQIIDAETLSPVLFSDCDQYTVR